MFHKLQCNLHTNVHVMYNHWEIVISTWCCWWPVYCESFHLVPFKCKDWWWRLLVSDIGRHDIGVIDSIEGACQVPEVYISFLRPCCCNLLLSDCCCLSKNTKQFTWLHSWAKPQNIFLLGCLLDMNFSSCLYICYKRNLEKQWILYSYFFQKLPEFCWYIPRVWWGLSLVQVFCPHPHRSQSRFLLHLPLTWVSLSDADCSFSIQSHGFVDLWHSVSQRLRNMSKETPLFSPPECQTEYQSSNKVPL